MHRTAKYSATQVILGSAALLLALGNGGCNYFLGIEELESQDDAAPGDDSNGEADAAPVASDPDMPADMLPVGSEYLGYQTEFSGVTTLTANTIWAVPINVLESRKLDELGFILHLNGAASANIKFGLYVDIEGKPGEQHVLESSASITTDGRSLINVEDTCLSSGWYWLVMRVEQQDITISSSLDDSISTDPIQIVNDYPYSADLPNPFIDGLAWTRHSNKAFNAYLVIAPLQTDECPVSATHLP